LITAGSLVVPGCGPDAETNPPARTITDGAAFFPQAVASGDPKPDGIILWGRIDDPAAAAGDLGGTGQPDAARAAGHDGCPILEQVRLHTCLPNP